MHAVNSLILCDKQYLQTQHADRYTLMESSGVDKHGKKKGTISSGYNLRTIRYWMHRLPKLFPMPRTHGVGCGSYWRLLVLCSLAPCALLFQGLPEQQ